MPNFKLQTDDSPRASLGCGTLIVIALIVSSCTGLVSQDMRQQLGGLRSDINELKEAVAAQTRQIQQLHESIKNRESPAKTEPAQAGE